MVFSGDRGWCGKGENSFCDIFHFYLIYEKLNLYFLNTFYENYS